MEKGLESPAIAPRIVEVMYFKGTPKQTTQPPDVGVPQQWESQWQEFLRVAQPAHMGQGNPQPTDAVPWEDAKSFLKAFEQVAEACRWPQEEWVGRLVPALRGGVEQYICQLDPQDRLDYLKVKAAILRSDTVRMEVKRQHFRQCSYQELEGPRRAYNQLQDLCRQWLKPETHTKEQILELIIQEQLLATLPPEVQNWLRECRPENCVEMVALAEDFVMGHRQARMWDRPVPLPEINRSPLEAERLPRQQSGGVTRQGNTNEVTPSRSSSVGILPGEPQTAEVGMTTEAVRVKEEVTDRNPTPWERMRESSGCGSSTSGLSMLPSERQEDMFAQSPEPDDRLLNNIKTEDTEDSDMDNSYEPFPEADSLELDSGRTLPPRNEAQAPPQRCQEKTKKKSDVRAPQKTSKDHTEVLSLRPAVDELDPVSRLRPRKPEESESLPLRHGIKTLRVVLTKLGNTRSGKVHRCPDCGYKTNWLSVLVNHMRVHTKEKPFMCQGCGRHFRYPSSLCKHQKHACSKSLLAAGDTLAEHLQTCGDEALQRMATSLQETSVSEMSSRAPEAGPKDPPAKKTHPCSKCDYRAGSLTDLIKHLRIHIGEKPYKCHICGKAFGSPTSFVKHWQTHKDSGAHPAATPTVAECDVTLSDDEELINVLAKKSGDKSGQAASAKGKAASAKGKVQQRKRSAPETLKTAKGSKKSRYENLEKKHKCPDCPYRCYYLSDLLRHQNVHARKKPYKCPDCGKSFPTKSSAEAHQKKCDKKNPGEKMKSHPGKKYSCSRCGHKTYKLSTLLVHLRTHMGERPFKCPECGDTFTQSSNLSRHRKIHRNSTEQAASQETSPSNPPEQSAGNTTPPLMKVKEEEMEMEITPEGDLAPLAVPGDSSAIAALSQRWQYNKEERKQAPPEGGFKLIEPKQEKDDEMLYNPAEPPKEEPAEVPITPTGAPQEAEADHSAEKPKDDLSRKEVSVRAMLEKFAYCKDPETDSDKDEPETAQPAVQKGQKPPSAEVTGRGFVRANDINSHPGGILCDQCGEGFSKESELVRHQLSNHWD